MDHSKERREEMDPKEVKKLVQLIAEEEEIPERNIIVNNDERRLQIIRRIPPPDSLAFNRYIPGRTLKSFEAPEFDTGGIINRLTNEEFISGETRFMSERWYEGVQN